MIVALQRWPERLWLAPLFGLAYQLGTSLAERCKLRAGVLLIADVVCIGSAGYLGSPELLFPVIVTLSWRIQHGREQHKIATPTHLKRAFRVIGFLGSGLLLIPYVAQLVWLSVSVFPLLSSGIVQQKLKTSAPQQVDWGIWSWIMVIHQLQYFVYVYGVLWILHVQGKVPLYLLAPAFAAGWISYLAVEPLVSSQRYRLVLVCGHVFLFVVLGCLAGGFWSPLTVLFWVLTGFGGGTVYCIKFLAPSREPFHVAEEVGHVLGPILACGLVLVTDSWASALWLASALALCTAVCAALAPVAEKCDDGIKTT